MSATSPAAPFSYPITVSPNDIDFMGHVNNARYLNWVQDAVLEHWNTSAPAEDVASKAWVALKHEITYRKHVFAALNHCMIKRACTVIPLKHGLSDHIIFQKGGLA
ncbi:MAG: acyl-CoA thioesterase, partial [Pseudomonadota bacterium]